MNLDRHHEREECASIAKFIIYRAAGGAEIRARVLTARRDGSQAVEALLFHQVGAGVPDLIGDRQRVLTAEVVSYEEDPQQWQTGKS